MLRPRSSRLSPPMNDAQRAVLTRSARLALACALALYCAGIAITFVSAPPRTVSQALAEGAGGVVGLGVFLFVTGAPLTLCALAVVVWLYIRAGRQPGRKPKAATNA